MQIPDHPRYWLQNCHLPPALCRLTPAADGWCKADVLVDHGRIAQVLPAGQGGEGVAADGSILLSAMVDAHTHLDKAHVAAFHDFPAGNLLAAIEAMADYKRHWSAENLARRVEFSLRTAFAYGVRAMRSHVDYGPGQADFIWPVMEQAVADWAGRVDLQLVGLSNLLHFDDPALAAENYAHAARHGRIGAFVHSQPDIAARLTPIFERAKAEGWDIDLHVDEGLDPALDGLAAVTEVTRATGFQGQVLCGHCVALNSYDAARRAAVIEDAVAAGLDFVALPVTNLYLQGRTEDGAPQIRGMTPVRPLVDAGARVSMGADNVRDGFCAFGDFDPATVLNIGAQVAHLDEPARDWAASITCNPACSIGLAWDGCIEAGAPADLVLFQARNSGEMATRQTPARQVIRNGAWITEQVPDFREM